MLMALECKKKSHSGINVEQKKVHSTVVLPTVLCFTRNSADHTPMGQQDFMLHVDMTLQSRCVMSLKLLVKKLIAAIKLKRNITVSSGPFSLHNNQQNMEIN